MCSSFGTPAALTLSNSEAAAVLDVDKTVDIAGVVVNQVVAKVEDIHVSLDKQNQKTLCRPAHTTINRLVAQAV